MYELMCYDWLNSASTVERILVTGNTLWCDGRFEHYCERRSVVTSELTSYKAEIRCE